MKRYTRSSTNFENISATDGLQHDPYYAADKAKKLALQTLNEIKRIYESDDSGLLEGAMYSDFMETLDEQIKNIEDYI